MPGRGAAYLRDDAIDAVGAFDPSLATAADALDDWIRRAFALGFLARRANHAFVLKTAVPGLPLRSEHARPSNGALLEHPHTEPTSWTSLSSPTLDAALAAHAVRLHVQGTIKVALDIRHVPVAQVGTRAHAVGLASALAKHPEIELTLLVRHPAQADGLTGRTVTESEWCDDVAVIHKPGQVFDRQELSLLFESSAHVVITYQDMIAYHVAAAFEVDTDRDLYRTTSSLSLLAAQHVIVFSENTAAEVHAEFGLPREEISVIPLGIAAEHFATRRSGDEEVLNRFSLPERYFLSLATDLPHKNLAGLITAYGVLRSRSCDGEPPGLALAGYALGSRRRLYESLRSAPLPEGLKLLGPVSDDELRVLYQNALALVYPSLYEGFGLPPLEAMAAGTPVIAMPISAVPEVGADGADYAEGLAPEDLARAMERLASSARPLEELRERGKGRAQQFCWKRPRRPPSIFTGQSSCARAWCAQAAPTPKGRHPALGLAAWRSRRRRPL